MTIVLLLSSLIFIKLQVVVLGIEIYGVLTLLLSVFGTVNLMNFGFGSALVKSFTINKDKSLYWGMFIVLSFFFLLITLVLLFVFSPFYQELYSFIGIGKEMKLNIFSFYGVGLIGISRLLGTIISSYWQAKIDFFKLKLFNFINTYISIVIIILLYYKKVDLNLILIIAGLINILLDSTLILYLLFSNSYTFSVIKIVTYNDLRSLGLDSKDFFLIQISNNILNPIINVGLAKSIGIEAVSLFDIANKFLRAGRQIIVSYSEPFFGLATQLLNEKKYKELKKEFTRNTKIMLVLSLIFVLFGYFFSNFMVTLWVGSIISNEIDFVIKIILVGFGVNIASSIIYYFFLAKKNYRKYVVIHQFIQLAIMLLIFILPLNSLNYFASLFSLVYFVSGLYIIFMAISIKNKFEINN